jgi:predicted flap endonuclease-1-like 5' DNA nuclease
MATKKSKKENKLGKAKAIVKKINNDLIDASFNAIETTVKTGEKWQKLTAKLLKKAEPLTKQQINMVVETAESIKNQLETGTDRLKTLVGYDHKMVENAKKMISENPLVEKAEEMKNKFEKEVAKNKFVKKAEKIADKIKKNITETIEEVKEKVDNYTDDILAEEPKKAAPKTKKAPVKKTTEKVVVEKVVIEKTEVVNDLKIIKGIGPVLEKSLNELNITSYAQIASMTIKDLTNLLNDGGVNAKIYDLAGWKEQAKLALKGDLEAVKNWTKK